MQQPIVIGARCALTRATLALTLTAGPIELVAQGAASAPCPRPRSTTATIGVGMYRCYGGNCVLFDSTGGAPSHTFTVEPQLAHVRPTGPAHGRLRDGDVVVAVDGALITTSQAGRALANPVAGQPIRFRVRRAGAVVETDVTPVAGCEDLTISVADSPDAEANGSAAAQRVLSGTSDISGFVRPATADEVPVDFGMTLDCDCGWRVPFFGGPLRFHSASAPRVAAVEPGGPAAQAGVHVGDVLDSIDGASFTGADESPAWGVLRPDRPATLRLRRGSVALRVIVTPRAPRRSRL
jgi:S1-C subfamily serine protease